MSSEKIERKKFPIFELPYNIGLFTNIAHTNPIVYTPLSHANKQSNLRKT